MFAPSATEGLVNCLEFVSIKEGYTSGISSECLQTVPISDRYLKSVYEAKDFAFGDNESAVWTIEIGSLPKLVSTQENSFNSFNALTFKEVKSEITDGVEKIELKVNPVNYGTKNNPFIIYDIESWDYYFNEENNRGILTGYYRIVKDIDFSSVGDNPKTSTLTFRGNIQGNNMEINGVMLYSSSNLSHLGLFGMLKGVEDKGIKNSVRNIVLNATSVWASSTESVGVLAGVIENFNVYNITIDAENVIMVGKNAVGGLAGVVRGEFDIDQISSNIGVNSTRASILSNYAIYISKNNNKDVSYNLSNVYYAGSVVGILDAYNRNSFRVDSLDGRNIGRGYYNVKNIKVSGNVTITGDTVGVAFGLVGEKVFVQNVKINVSGSVFGSQYSSGFAGENRGVVDNVEIVLANDLFYKSKYVSAGAVGFNMGGLVRNVKVRANIIKTGYGQIVGGVVGRNVYGTIANSTFDGEIFAYLTGGILGADYTDIILLKSSVGSGAINADARTNKNLIPTKPVEYFENNTKIENFSCVALSRETLNYMIENSTKFYSYRKEENPADLSAITIKSRVLGLVVGLSYQSSIMNKNGQDFMIELTIDEIIFNGEKENVDFNSTLNDVGLNEDSSVTFDFENVNTLNCSIGRSYVMYILGSQVASFDAWASYSNEYILVQ